MTFGVKRMEKGVNKLYKNQKMCYLLSFHKCLQPLPSRFSTKFRLHKEKGNLGLGSNLFPELLFHPEEKKKSARFHAYCSKKTKEYPCAWIKKELEGQIVFSQKSFGETKFTLCTQRNVLSEKSDVVPNKSRNENKMSLFKHF